jgi:formylglycine-generating enzyme required for sulfatase activity
MGTRIDLPAMDDQGKPHRGRPARHPEDVQLVAPDWHDDVVVPPPDHEPAPPPPPRRRIWPWAVTTLGVGGVVAGVIALSGGDQPTRPTNPIVVAPDANVANTSADDPYAPNDPSGAAARINNVSAPHASSPTTSLTQPGASTSAPDAAPDRAKDAPNKRPNWVAAVERMNPWVQVAPARGKVVLGVSASQLADAKARATLTGFFPNKDVQAPTTRFAIQQHEVTWAEVERYVEQSAAGFDFTMPAWVPRTAEARARLPATGVPWELANAYCQAIGGNLPSEAEWEWAARGKALSTFPWGNDLPFATRVQIRRGQPIPLAEVKTRDQDVTPDGVVDLLGNAQEWTRDRFTANRLGGVDQPPGDELHRAVRGWPLGPPGGSIPTEGITMRHSVCAAGDCPAKANELVGFRCVK